MRERGMTVAEFADRVTLQVQAGHGGNGCASIHREKFKPLGGPDGGNGGRGGDVILEVDASSATLLDFHRRPVRRAGNGRPGEGSNRTGADATDLVIPVPNGTEVKTADGEVLADLIGVGTRFVAAGAGRGKGLGHDFLRHVERCSTLVHVLDCATEEPGRDPVADLAAIEEELAAYGDATGAELVTRPRLIVLNKIDVPAARDMAELVRPEFEQRGYQVFEISAATGEGLRRLGFAMAALVAADRAARPAELPAERVRVRVKVKAADEPGFEVVRLGDSFLIMGEKPRRWVQQTDFSNDEAVGYLADRLARLGVEEALAEAGAEPGAEVLIGDPDDAVVFDWDPAAPMASGASGPSKSGRRGSGRGGAGHGGGRQHLGPRGTDPRLTP